VPEPSPAASRTEHDTYAKFVDPFPAAGKLDALKDEVRRCGRPIRDYPCTWTGEGFSGLDALGCMVLDDLWSGVLRDERYVSKDVWRQALGGDPDCDPRYTDESAPVPENLAEKIVALAKPPPKAPSLEAERKQMQAFAASNLRCFQGRTRELQQLTDFLASTDGIAPRLAVVAAAPGQGKSPLIARLHEALWELPQRNAEIAKRGLFLCSLGRSGQALTYNLSDARILLWQR
jgi:hypothetical protein